MQAKVQKPVQICTNCFFENFSWQVKPIRHINEWFKNHLKCRMISSDAHLVVLRKSVLVFTDLMKTACSNDELVCAFRCIQLRRCSNPLIRICLSHLSVFMFCSLSVSSLCFLFNEDCMLKSGRRLLFLLSSIQGVKVWLVIASKSSIIPGESYPLAFISMAVKRPPRSIWFDLCSTLSCHWGSSLSKGIWTI